MFKSLGQLAAEFDIVRHCVFCNVLAAVGEDSLLGLGAFGNSGLEHDKGLDLVHFIRVGNADDAAHVNKLVRVENVFKLAGMVDNP